MLRWMFERINGRQRRRRKCDYQPRILPIRRLVISASGIIQVFMAVTCVDDSGVDMLAEAAPRLNSVAEGQDMRVHGVECGYGINSVSPFSPKIRRH